MLQHVDRITGSFFGPSTLVELLQHRAEHQRDDTAFRFLLDGESQDECISYAELDRQSRAIGAWLQSMNMGGQRALLLYPAGLDFIRAFFGCMYAGVVAVPAYPPRRNRKLSRIEMIVKDAQAQLALTTETLLGQVQGVLSETPELQKITWLTIDQTPSGMDAKWNEPDVHADSLAFLQYTSGSTGDPKGVMLSHANLIHNAALIAYAFELTRTTYTLFWLPVYHDMGLIGGVLQPIYIGRPSTLFSPMSFLQKPVRWLQAISNYRLNVSGGPSFAYDLCTQKVTPEEREQLDLSCWRVAFNGAEPVREKTIERFCEVFEPCGFRREAFYPCYGLAEATLLVSGGMSSAPPTIRSFDSESLTANRVVDVPADEEDATQLVGCGGALLDQTIVIANPDTLCRVEPDEVGEIWVSGPSVARGYWDRIEQSTETFRAYLKDTGEGPFLRTSDLGFIHENELFVTGRLKDLIIVRGTNHYPQDIELTAEQSHERLRTGCGAAFTVDADGHERLVIVYEIQRRRLGQTDEVFEAIRRDVSSEHGLAVDGIVLIKAGNVLKTSSGKIQRLATREAFVRGELSIVAQWGIDGDAAAEVAEHPLRSETPAPESNVAPPVAEVIGGRRQRAAAGPSEENGRAADSAGLRQSTIDLVFQKVREVAGERAGELTLDTNIVDLGLDSLERIDIATTVEDAFGGHFPEHVLTEIETCREVAEAAERYLGSGQNGRREKVIVGDVPPEYYRFDKNPEYLQLKRNFQMLEAAGTPNPYFSVHERVTNDTTVIDGREMISFSSYNYLGMSGDPTVSEAAQEAVAQFGTSVSASRLVSGEITLHRELEAAISGWLGVEAAIVYVGGHATNETTIGHLFGPGDLILHDALAHNSIVQGCILSGARRRPFPHSDWQALDKLLDHLRCDYRRVLIAIEGVYSMDGDFPDLPKFIEVKKRHKALLMVDEAHSIGTMGACGRGIGEHFDVKPTDVDLWMGTLSKSLGSCGGYIAGCKEVVETLKYTAPGFVYSVGLSPPNAAAALAALRLLEDEPQRVQRLQKRARLFLSLAKERGLNTGFSNNTPVVPVILGNSQHALMLSRALFEREINVQPILYPAVEESAARLRFFITADHTSDQIRQSVDAVAQELAKIDPGHLTRPPQEPTRSDQTATIQPR